MKTGTMIKKPVTFRSKLAKPIGTVQQRPRTQPSQTSYLSTSPAFFSKTRNLTCRRITAPEVLALAVLSLVFTFFISGKHDVE